MEKFRRPRWTYWLEITRGILTMSLAISLAWMVGTIIKTIIERCGG